jgi:NTE family protein
MAEGPYRVLCLGGGATNLTLMSGALHKLNQAGLHENNNIKGPNIITMAGACAVVGLHYLAPSGIKSKDRFTLEALENTINLGVADAIFEMFPINYKVFTKSGPSADLFNEFWFNLPEVQEAMHQSGMNDDEVLLSDALLFAGAMMCPTDISFFSQGICGHAQFLEEFIDFKALQSIDPNEIEIEINAFSIEDHKVVDFTNYERDDDGNPLLRNGKYIAKEITVDHLRAALSYPFLHPPYKIGDRHYFEGAAIQCVNDYFFHDAKKIDWILVLDPLRKNMIGVPQNLWDAFALSIIMPTAGLTELGQLILEFKTKFGAMLPTFGELERKFIARNDKKLSALELMAVVTAREGSELYLSEFKIPEENVSQAWGWSRSSMKDLFKIGQKAGREIADDMRGNGDWP